MGRIWKWNDMCSGEHFRRFCAIFFFAFVGFFFSIHAMLSLSRSFLAAALLIAPIAASAAGPQDYDTIRRIAMRDRRVQDAFAKAYQRLDERIIEVDPSLAGYVKSHPAGQSTSASTSTRGSTTSAHPAPTHTTTFRAEPKKAPAPAANQKTHTVQSGETLSSIAAQYGVSAESIQGTNRIRDAKKLKVGQVLVIPAKK